MRERSTADPAVRVTCISALDHKHLKATGSPGGRRAQGFVRFIQGLHLGRTPDVLHQIRTQQASWGSPGHSQALRQTQQSSNPRPGTFWLFNLTVSLKCWGFS